MKVTVTRKLSNGLYNVGFSVAEFSSEEVQKMASFGVPYINLQWGGGNRAARTTGQIALNQITPALTAAFPNEADAKKYEETVLAGC